MVYFSILQNPQHCRSEGLMQEAYAITRTGFEPEVSEGAMEFEGVKAIQDREHQSMQSRKGVKLNQWKEANMKEALHAKLDQKSAGRPVSIRQLSKDFDVPFSTLRRRINGGDSTKYKHQTPGKALQTIWEEVSQESLEDVQFSDMSDALFSKSTHNVEALALDSGMGEDVLVVGMWLSVHN